ncbi:MAG: PAS domain S-box protein [Chloroflexi bacterium]|nr:PAS domain S-box protein [Chloroflexota bacterium]OJV87034.1 MAG: hypothetical protein BGO39_33250 [Chloroflexi bacterium 54-19]
MTNLNINPAPDSSESNHELQKENKELHQQIANLKKEAASHSSGLLGSEEDYRRLVEFSPDAIAIHQKGRFVYVNQAGANLIGAKNGEELVGKPLLDVVHPDYRQMVIKRATQTTQGITTSLQEEKFVRLDGRVIDVEVVAIPIQYEGQPATQVVVVDVTEKKRLAEELRANEERLRLASEAGGLGTWEWDVAADKITLSPNIQTLLGPRTGKFENNLEGFYRLVHPEDRPRVQQNLAQVLEKGEPYDIEFRLNGDGSRPVWIAARARAFFNTQGQPQRLIGVLQNITPRKQAEENLRLLVEASHILAADLDFEATLQNLALLVVPLLADWCAVDLVDKKKHLRRVVLYHSDPDRLEFARKLEERYPPHMAQEFGLVALMKAGKAVIIAEVTENNLLASAQNEEHGRLLVQLGLRSSVIIPLVARDEPLGVLSLSHAESGRQYTAEDLDLLVELGSRAALALDNALLYRKAQEAIQERENFLSVAAHELKTPVTGMRGYAQLLTRQVTKGTIRPEGLAQAVNTIYEQSNKLTQLINQLLDITRIEAGKLALNLQPTNLSEVVRSAVNIAQTTTTRHTLLFQEPASPVLIKVDALRIEQVLTNLLDNAIKYSPEGGPVEIEFGYDISEEEPIVAPGSDMGVTLQKSREKRVRLAVKDWGLGVPEEKRALIFDRYYQAHPGSYIGGMGLGLHITKQIVELHGGEIRAEFPDTGGSKFIVILSDSGLCTEI